MRNDQEFMYEPIQQIRAPNCRRDVNMHGCPTQGGHIRCLVPPVNIEDEVDVEQNNDHNANPNFEENELANINNTGDITQNESHK